MSSFEGKNYYEILGIPRDADTEQIRKAHREKARKLHPDVNKAADASEQFAKVQEAYDVLSDTEKRAAYDNFLRYGFRAGGPAGDGGSQQWEGGGFQGFDPSEFASIFEQFMGARSGNRGGSNVHVDFGYGPEAGQRRWAGPGGSGAGAGTGAGVRRPQRGRDIRHAIEVPFMVAVLGGTEKLRLSVDGESQTLDVRIPAGIESGAKLRLKGRGGMSGSMGESGDLILAIRVGNHPYFRREGLDILLEVPVTVAEAVVGVTVTLPLLVGRIDLRVPAGTSSGRRLRVKGKGIDDGKEKGDFYAIVQIVAPQQESLTDSDREFFENLANKLENPRDELDWSDSM